MLFLINIGQAQSSAPGLQVPPLATETSWWSLSPLPTLLHSALPTQPLPLRQALRQSPVLPPAYRYEDLALFCKWEVRMEKTAKIPVKVRLGDVPTVDRLEGKQ